MLFQRRFIDNGFIVFELKAHAANLIQQMSNTKYIKFRHKISNEEAIFLDFEIFKGRRFVTEQNLISNHLSNPTKKFPYLPENLAIR